MNILLIDPKINAWGYSAPKSIDPFGLICVATFLNHSGQKAEILDMNASNVGWEEFSSVIRERNPDIECPVL